MHGLPLLQRGAQGAVQAVLEVVVALPVDDVGEQVALEGGILLEQLLQIERPLRGHQLVEPDLLRGDRRPLPLHVAVLGVGAALADALEDHGGSLTGLAAAASPTVTSCRPHLT